MTQLAAASVPGGNTQVINVGSVANVSARNVATNAFVGGAVTQIAAALSSGNKQEIVVGGVEGNR